jgi:hypothetical protein
MDGLGSAMLLEGSGGVRASLASAVAFFLPSALRLPGGYPASALLFFLSCVWWERLVGRAALNPATHVQAFWLGRASLPRALALSAADLVGYSCGNWLALALLRLLDPAVSFEPLPPAVSPPRALLVEAGIFMALQWFTLRVSSAPLPNALFCTLVIFACLDLTGAYSSPSAYFSKAIASGTPLLHPCAHCYLLGPLLGAALMTPVLHKHERRAREARKRD